LKIYDATAKQLCLPAMPTPLIWMAEMEPATASMAWMSGTHYTDTKGTTATAMKLHL